MVVPTGTYRYVATGGICFIKNVSERTATPLIVDDTQNQQPV